METIEVTVSRSMLTSSEQVACLGLTDKQFQDRMIQDVKLMVVGLPPSWFTESQVRRCVTIQTERTRFEELAKLMYAKIPGSDEHPWVEGGNSHKQEEARGYARVAMAAAQEGLV